MTAALTGWRADDVQHRATSLRATLRAHEKWTRLCSQLSRNRRAFGEQDPRTVAARQAWEKGRPISKVRKHRAYDDARSIAVALGLETPPEFRGTVDEWRWAIEVAERAAA